MPKVSHILQTLDAKKRMIAKREEQTHDLTQDEVATIEHKRNLSEVGGVGISCNFPCFGPEASSVPEHRSAGKADASKYGIKVEAGTLWVHRCNLTKNKLCVVGNDELRELILRGKETG